MDNVAIIFSVIALILASLAFIFTVLQKKSETDELIMELQRKELEILKLEYEAEHKRQDNIEKIISLLDSDDNATSW